jgi:YDG domain-containing protein/galactose oxidase-like protein
MLPLNRPTSSIRLFSTRGIRIALLFGLIGTVATVLSTPSFAGSIGQKLFAAAIMGGNSNQHTDASHSSSVEFVANVENSSMASERHGHTATRMADGRVLIAGGENAGGVLNQTEIYDPASGAFTAAANMASARVDHSATLLADGRVLIAGGRDGGAALATTEFFDPATGSFIGGPTMSVARAGHSATVLANGQVLVVGGDANGTAELLDLAAGTSTATGSMGVARSLHSAALLQDGRVLIVGGRDANGNALSSGEIFDTPAGLFSTVAGTLAVSRVHAHVRVLFDGKVQIIGGNNDGSMEIYDPVIEGFGAYAHVLPEGDPCTGLPGQIQSSQTRAALFHNGQSDAIFDRSSYSMSELSDQAIVIGGMNSSGDALSSAPTFNSSNAAISTDKLDYSPGETAHITGHGFQPGETVRLKIHEDPHTPQERGMDVVADDTGSFVGDYLVMNYDLDMKFIVGARGLSSARTAQTTFTDSQPTAVSLTPSSQTVSPGGSAAYTVSVTVGGNSSNCTMTLTAPFATPTPVGVGVSFSGGASITTNSSFTKTLTLTTTNTGPMAGRTQPGSYPFTLTVAKDATCQGSATPVTATGTLVVANPNVAPVASAVSISGTAQFNQLLTGNYTYSDADGDAQGASTFRWLRNGTTVVGTNQTYTTVSADVGQTLTFEVTPVAATGVSPGAAVTSAGVVIGKAPSTTVITCPASVVYSGAAQTPCTATATGTGGLNVSVTVVYGNNTNAGTATANATYGGDATHNGSTATQVTFTIDKAGSTTTINCPTNVTYDGSPKTPCSATATGAGGLNVSVTVVYGNNTNAGTATADATFAGDANHNGSTATQVTFTIDKASSSTTINCPTNVTYNGSPQTPCSATATGAGGLNVSVTVVYGNNTNAGTATANATFAGDANHNGSTATQVTFTIDKASSSTTINCPTNVTYNGSPLTPCTATATGAGGLNVSVTVGYGNNTNAGTATADATFAGDANHNGSTATQVTFTIDKASSSTTINCPTNVTYSGLPQTPCSATAIGAGALNVSVTVTYANNTNAGTATADATYAGDANHNGSTATQVSFAIDKANSSTTINCPTNVTYDGSAQTPCTATATGVGGLNVSVTVTYTNNTDAGIAAADATYGGDANHNGSTATTVNFTIDKADSTTTINCPTNVTYNGSPQTPCTATATGAGSLNASVNVTYTNNTNAGTATADATFAGDANHNTSTATQVTFTIDKANSSTSINCPTNVTYNGSPHTPCSATATGVGGLNTSVTVVYANNTNAGTATADATYAGDANHNSSTATQVTFTVDKRTITASITGNPTKVYDGNTNATLTAGNFLIGNLVAGQSVTVTQTAGTYNSKDVVAANSVSTTLGVGDFSAGAGTNLNNYNLPTSASGAGQITPKALAITADNKSFLFGSPLVTLTASFNAFAAGEGVGNLTGTLIFKIKDASNNEVPYNAGTPAGTYAIVPSGVTSTNYNISFVNGTLTIGAWTLMGFYQPIDMSGGAIVWNSIKGGSTVPLKFNIFANGVEKKAVTDIQGFAVAEVPCLSSGLTTDVEFTTTGGTSLRYDTTGAQYIQNWQTPKPAGKCYQVRMTALDGSHLDAYFKSK